MKRSDIEHLQSIREYPSVSILLRTHRTVPENGQDPIRVRNLVSDAMDRLLGELPRRDVEPVLTRLESLANEVDYRSTLDGLALFVNRSHAHKFYLPFPVQERVVVGDSFAIRDLVHLLNRRPRYWVLALSEQPTRLFEGLGDHLAEVTRGGFPLNYEGPGATEPLPSGYGVRRSAHRDEAHRQFFRQVEAAFAEVRAAEPLPLVLVGVDRHLAFFDEVTKHKGLVVARLAGAYDKTPAHELAKRVWPLMQEYLSSERQRQLANLEKAVSARKAVSATSEAWHMAQQGRIAMLLVEDDFHYPARPTADGHHLAPTEDPSAPDVMADAVDDLIQVVLSKGGQVTFVDNGALRVHQRVAGILRY